MNNSVYQIVSRATVEIGPPAVIVVINPYAFWFAITIFLVTCALICGHIILNCLKREKRLDMVTSRAVRRAHAKLVNAGKL